MVHLDSGNMLLKPAQRKQLMSRLRRSIRLGDRIGQFVLKLSLRRSGRCVEMLATVQDSNGNFAYRTRQQNLSDAMHDMVRRLSYQIHDRARSS